MSFGKIIIKWYAENKRDLPWRNSRNPYLIWLSEIILQQTRVEQGLPYFHKFSETYPNIKSLAKASEDQVLKLWQGLGYYSRARNLHAAANQVINEFDGKFPADFKSILSLKGVGEYTASAIASFAFDLEYAVVDGNVFRLLSRYFGITTPIDTSGGKKEFTAIAMKLLKGFPPAIYNQAIMEFGARQCKPANPDCASCPLNISCYAYKKKAIPEFPVKKNKTKSRNRFFHYLIIWKKDSYYIKKRTEKDIWQGLHDFPLIETKTKISDEDLLKSKEWKSIFRNKKVILNKISTEYKHVLSHQLIHAKFYEIRDESSVFNDSNSDWKKVNQKTVTRYAVPKLIEQYLEGTNQDTD